MSWFSQYASYRPIFGKYATGQDEKPSLPFDEQAKPLIAEEGDETTTNFSADSASKKFSRMVYSYLRVIAALMVFCLLLVVLGLGIRHILNLNGKQPGRASGVMVKPCGGSPEEATERGCHFDVISFCWLPEECYDAELSRDFDSENQLEWFLDPNRTEPLTHDEIMTGRFTGLYVNWEYHVRHCTAMWKKMHRAILGDLGNRAIDGYIGTYEHTKHCENMLIGGQGIAFDTINTRIAVKYPDCGI